MLTQLAVRRRKLFVDGFKGNVDRIKGVTVSTTVLLLEGQAHVAGHNGAEGLRLVGLAMLSGGMATTESKGPARLRGSAAARPRGRVSRGMVTG